MREFLRFSQGKVTADNSEAKKRLEEISGKFYLAPTSPDWIVAVRAGARGGVAERPRVLFAGDLSGVPLADLLGLLTQCRMTGVLRVLSTSGERAIMFNAGEVHSAASDNPGERIGEIAVRFGYLQREDFDKLLATKPPGVKIGRLLIENGHLKPHDLFKCLQQQVAEIFHSILLAHQGAYFFVDQPVEEEQATLSMSTQSLLMDSIRRIDESREFEAHIPTPEVYISAKKAAGHELEPDERRLLELCTGELTVLELAQRMKLTVFDTTKLCYHLIEGGYALSSAIPLSAATKPELGLQQVLQVFARIFQMIFEEVGKVVMPSEFIAIANSAVAELSMQSPLLLGANFDENGILDSEIVLENARASSHSDAESAKAVQSVLSEFVFFLFFEAAEMLHREVDAELQKNIKELLHTLESE